MSKVLRSILDYANELRAAFRTAADISSFARLAIDYFLRRAIGRMDLPDEDRERQIRVRGDINLCYRLNRGDLQSIREVWFESAYRTPFPLSVKFFVDLGANIGLTSVWIANRHPHAFFVAVEPSTENARIAQKNFSINHLEGEIIEAAVGPLDGVACFEASRDSNVGRVGSGAATVRMVSMNTVLSRFPSGVMIDLVKMDIEGSEQPLLEGNIEWLERVTALIVEFHPAHIDYRHCINILRNAGFRYFPAGSVFATNMDAFLRE